MTNWIAVQAIATIVLVLVVAADSIIYYIWHAEREHEQSELKRALKAYKELTVDETGE